ncbi:MAG: hypothetical protein Aureis2KO_23960 [Aureisphaera sp.]
MMKKYACILLLLIAPLGFAQINPIDFEDSGNGGLWTWTVFENDTNPPLEIIANPDPTGINTSATVAKFTALQAGQPFAGVESMHGSDIGTFSLSSENAIVKIKVWKSVISDVGIKFATPEGASTGEIKVANTLINTWEELAFDFTPVIGEPSSNGIDQIIVFPDFNNRSSDNVIYFDSITFSDSILGSNDLEESSISSAPNPVNDSWHIKSNEVINTLTLYNISGQRIKAITLNDSSANVDLTQLKTGIYFVEVTFQSSRKSTLKLLKN